MFAKLDPEAGYEVGEDSNACQSREKNADVGWRIADGIMNECLDCYCCGMRPSE
jgi:hypothetical protein